MKCPVILNALFILVLIIAPVAATQLTFQNTDDIATLATNPSSAILTQNYTTEGGNQYIRLRVTIVTGAPQYFYINSPELTTYAAATYVGGVSGYGDYYINLYDSGKASIYSFGEATATGSNARIEVNVTSGIARVYRNGVLRATSGLLGVNPSYVGFGTNAVGVHNVFWDDVVYGTTENKYIFGQPISNQFVIIKDDIGGAGSGLYYSNETLLVSSYNMTSTWSKGVDNSSVTVGMYNIAIQNSPVCTNATTAGVMTGSIPWPLQDCLFNNANASQGYYYTTVYGSGVLSNLIVYKGKGATVTLDKDFYSTGEPATGTWVIDNIPYWDTVNYDYAYRIADVYGNVKYTVPISSQTGSASYTWLTTDAEGVYYADVLATPKAGGDEILMACDYATLSGTFSISGYVNEDESALPISGALVNFTQGSIRVNTTSAADGSYNATGFTTGTVLLYNASAANYQNFNYSFTPQYAHIINLNITLSKNTHTYLDFVIGGVARDNTYGRPISNTLVAVRNTTSSQYYTATTNNAGWYNKSALTFANLYDVWGSKTGFSNSTTYQVMMV